LVFITLIPQNQQYFTAFIGTFLYALHQECFNIPRWSNNNDCACMPTPGYNQSCVLTLYALYCEGECLQHSSIAHSRRLLYTR
jgi:hypothetical protein